jgi:serine protease
MKARAPLPSLAAAAALALAACSGDPVTPPPAVVAPALAVAAADGDDPVVAGEILVKLKEGASLDALGKAHGLAAGRAGYKAKLHVLHAAKGNERAAAAKLARDPRVEYAEPNYLRRADAIDQRLWAFRNPGGLSASFTDGGALPTTYSSIRDADEDAIEGIGSGGAAVVVGDIDSGVDMDHPEFAGRLIAGRDWVNNDANPEDDHGHGTHTTGTIGGSSVGVAGVTGATSNVKIHVQKVCYPTADGGASCPTSAIVNAIYAAADYPGMVAMNLSLGGGTLSTAEKNAIAYATNKGVLVIASAGNSGRAKVGCPACDENAISVAATNWRDALAYYTNYGKGLDISAPGGELYSNTTDEMGIWSAYLNGGYTYMQGTSMAAPQVTGAAAVVASKTGLRGASLRNRLLGTVDDLGARGYDTKFGNGRLNVYRAITGQTLGSGL